MVRGPAGCSFSGRALSQSSKRAQKLPGWQTLARCLVNSPSCLISRTQWTCVHWKPRSFHVANATTLLAQNPIAILYVATTLAHRLHGANHALIELKNQLLSGEPHDVVAITVSKMEGLLSVGGVTRPGDKFIDD